MRTTPNVPSAPHSRSATRSRPEFELRIAVHSGEALVTLDAEPHTGEGIVTGDVVNTASRLQGLAPRTGSWSARPRTA